MHRLYLQFLPLLKGDIETIQPALFNVSTFHIVYGNRKAQEELGYNSELDTMEGLYLCMKDWNERVEARLAKTSAPRGIKNPMQDVAAMSSDMPVVLPAANVS